MSAPVQGSASRAPAIDVKGLGKRYVRGGAHADRTLGETIADGTRAVLRRRRNAPRRQQFWALEDVSFAVQPGEVLGVVGHNGAGKSTLLKLLSRITPPTRGRIELRGRVGSLLEVGSGFHPELTGAENIYLNGAILGLRRREIRQRFAAIAAFAEVDEFLDTPVKRYSSGMFVRLAFAVAAHLDPEILLVDEVLAVGDAAFQKKCLGTMRDVAGEGRTVLLVSHDLAAIQQLSHRALWIDRGRVAADGPTGTVIQSYLSSLRSRATVACDVRDAPRPFHWLSRRARLESVALDGLDAPILAADQPLRLRIAVRAAEAIPALRFGMTLTRLDGIAVGTVFASAPGGMAADERAEFVLTLCADGCRLAPGSYAINLSVGTGDHRNARREFDIVRELLPFEVLATDRGERGASEWHAAWGAVQLSAAPVERLTPS